MIKGLAGGIAAAGLAAVTRGQAGAGPTPAPPSALANRERAAPSAGRRARRAAGTSPASARTDHAAVHLLRRRHPCQQVNGAGRQRGYLYRPLLHDCDAGQDVCGCVKSNVCSGSCINSAALSRATG